MNMIADQRAISRVAGIIASALLLVSIGWGCGGDDDSSPATFADGLTAEDILERAGESDFSQPDIPVRVRVTNNGEVKEITIVGEDTYTVTFDDGDPDKEFLQYAKKSYVRDYGSDSWEREPALDSIFSALRLGRIMIEDMDFDSWGHEITRLSDSEIDGRRMLRIRLETSGSLDEGPLEGLLDEIVPESIPLPSGPFPDEVSSTMVLWIAADDFLTTRIDRQTAAFTEGEKVLEGEETIEVLESGASVSLPSPLPE